jgi:hypothetical protein
MGFTVFHSVWHNANRSTGKPMKQGIRTNEGWSWNKQTGTKSEGKNDLQEEKD